MSHGSDTSSICQLPMTKITSSSLQCLASAGEDMLVSYPFPPPRERRTLIPLLWQVEIWDYNGQGKFRARDRPLPEVIKNAMSTYL